MDGITKQQIMDNLLPLQQVLTREQYQRSRDFLDNMSEERFQQMLSELMGMAGTAKPTTPREYFEKIQKLREHNGVTHQNTALRDCPIRFLTEEENQTLWRDACRTAPSDHICLTGKDDDALCDLWRHGRPENQGVPSDLFFAENIPLLDCAITVDEHDKDPVNGRVNSYRVVVFEDYKERIGKKGDDGVAVGAVLIGWDDAYMVIPLLVCRGVDTLMTGRIGWHGVPASKRAELEQVLSQQDLSEMMWAACATWYGIQIALLHPLVKTVFQHSGIEIVHRSDRKTGHRRRTCYMKHHIVRASDIEAALHGTGRDYTRRTLVWYVIGHWRHYADGRKVFIQPYWKGALRNLKRNLDDRERDIVIGGIMNEDDAFPG